MRMAGAFQSVLRKLTRSCFCSSVNLRARGQAYLTLSSVMADRKIQPGERYRYPSLDPMYQKKRASVSVHPLRTSESCYFATLASSFLETCQMTK